MGIFDMGRDLNMLDSFLNPQKGYEKAGEQAEKYYQEGQNYLRPYQQHGLEQYGDLNKARQSLMNPEELYSKWASGYLKSPYAKRLEEMNLQQGQEAASSMGLMGSSGALQNIQQGAGDIVAKDRENYLKDIMDKYMKGIGLGESLYGTGANAGGAMAGNSMTQGTNMAGLAYGQQNAPGALFGKLVGGGVGAMVGGPAGAKVGANMFN